MQIFTQNSNQWLRPPLTAEEVQLFHQARQKTDIWPVVVHDIYLINLASPNRNIYHLSRHAFEEELERAERLGLPYVVMHPGSHLGSGEAVGLARIAQALDQAFSRTAGYKVEVVLEITAGQGDHLGYRFEHLAQIMDQVKTPERLGVCFDTCHAFAAGYDLRTPEAYAETWAEFERVLGLSALRVIHLNDSKKGLGSRVDRHAHIGEGKLGLEVFRRLVNDRRFISIPMLLETPKEVDEAGVDMDVVNLGRLRELIAT